jgi:uncharacterized membrane protein HdeD (DUF308 family)
MAVENVLTTWWGLALRGIIAILFGAATLAMPGITLFTLVLLFGAYAIVEGVVAVVSSIQVRKEQQYWWVILLEGLVSIAAGVLTFAWPAISGLALLFVIAFWAIAHGVLEIVAAVKLRKQIHGEWLLGLSGLLSIAFGVVMIAYPGVGALAMAMVIGIYAIIFGVLLIILGGRLLASTRRHDVTYAH